MSIRLAEARERLSLRGALRFVNRRKWFLVWPVVLAVAAAGAVLSQIVPEYGATALIVIEAPQSKPVTSAASVPSFPEPTGGIANEVDFLRSAAFGGQVVEKLGLAQDPEFGAAPKSIGARAWKWARAYVGARLGWEDSAEDRGTQDRSSAKARALAQLTDAVSVAVQPPSSLIAIEVRSAERAKAERIADAFVALYLADKAAARAEAIKHADEFFQGRLSALRADTEAAERALADFRARSNIAMGDGKTTAARTLDELNSQLNQARMQTAERESRLKALQRAETAPASRAGLAEILANPVISGLQLQESDVARRVADLSQRYGDNYPRVSEARAELAQIQGRISAEIAKIMGSMRGDVDAARAKEAQLKEQVDRFEQQASSQGQAEDEFRKLQQRVEAARGAYRDMLKRSNEQQERLQIRRPEARAISAASTSDRPVFPRYGRTLYLSALAGLVIGLVWALARERLDSGFRSAEQVERLTGHPLIGMIPLLRRSASRRSSTVQFVVSKPMSAYSEALRSTLTTVALGTAERTVKIVMVTSSVPGEGKSTFACSLATLAARSNPAKKVLLVDCDLRRASVATLLGATSTGGTIDQYLLDKIALRQVFGRMSDSGLYYVLSRSNTPNSAELLASESMRSFVGALAEQFDLVILDTPPLMAVSDPRVIAQLADYVIFLVRWERTDRELAINALKLVDDAKAGVGVVLSQVDLRRHARYGYSDYGAYYSKYHDYYVD